MTTVENQIQTYELVLHFKRPLYNDMHIVKQPCDVIKCLRQYIAPERISYKEFFWVILLTRAHSIIGISEVASGTTDCVSVSIKEIAQLALLSNCSSVVIAHNHPSGKLQSSESDRKITQRISKALKLFDIQLIDHIIITQESSYSLYDNGDFNHS